MDKIDIKVKVKNEENEKHYEIYVNNKFECSCDIPDLKETMQEVEQKYKIY